VLREFDGKYEEEIEGSPPEDGHDRNPSDYVKKTMKESTL